MTQEEGDGIDGRGRERQDEGDGRCGKWKREVEVMRWEEGEGKIERERWDGGKWKRGYKGEMERGGESWKIWEEGD